MSVVNELIKELREIANCYYGEICSYAGKIEEAADTIESLSAKLQAANIERSADCGGGWILVSERMPEGRIDVLVSFEDNHNPLVAWYSTVNDHWNNSCTDSVIKANIIAWQPLPEPYHEH